MTRPRFDTCPECGFERNVRMDGTFRLHGVGVGIYDRRTCAGSHKPAPNLTAVQYMSDAERLRQIRAMCESLNARGVWSVPTYRLREILDA